MPILQENHFSVFWDQLGSPEGSQILMLHGLASTPHLSFLGIEGELSKHYRMISPHLPGQGENFRLGLSDPRQEFTATYPETAVEIFSRLLDQLGLERVNVLGYSLGGLLGTVFAALAPSRVQKLILLAPGFDGNRSFLLKEAELMSRPGMLKNMPREVEPWLRALIRFYGTKYPVMGEALMLLYQYGFFDAWCETGKKLAPRVSSKTLLIHGEEDKIVPVKASLWLHETLPDSRLQVLPGVGHGLHNDSLQAASEIANLIRTFIDEE